MTRTVCSCGMPEIVVANAAKTGMLVEPYSYLWHLWHQQRHLKAFPTCDDITRTNLQTAIDNTRDGV